jgi:hypothetical protein
VPANHHALCEIRSLVEGFITREAQRLDGLFASAYRLGWLPDDPRPQLDKTVQIDRTAGLQKLAPLLTEMQQGLLALGCKRAKARQATDNIRSTSGRSLAP